MHCPGNPISWTSFSIGSNSETERSLASAQWNVHLSCPDRTVIGMLVPSFSCRFYERAKDISVVFEIFWLWLWITVVSVDFLDDDAIVRAFFLNKCFLDTPRGWESSYPGVFLEVSETDSCYWLWNVPRGRRFLLLKHLVPVEHVVMYMMLWSELSLKNRSWVNRVLLWKFLYKWRVT